MSACTTRRRSVPRLQPQWPLILELTRRASQAARVMALQAAYRKAQLKQGREDAPTAGQIRSLGLLHKEDDTKKVLGSSS